MNREQIESLYDAGYAASYEEKFIHSELAKVDSEFEVQMLGRFLRSGCRWLDVACGTGYYLSRFPKCERAGLDLSPAMLSLARQANPGIPLLQHDFRDPYPAWHDRWGLVSCLWYAYCLVDSVPEVATVIRNLASWTASDGACFVPLADPRLISGVDLPYEVKSPWKGKVYVSGIYWSYVEDDGRKVHAHLISPSVDFMVEEFQKYFPKVEILEYPPAAPGWQSRAALVASGKKKG
jgi:SAM-dependent methyltransferase